MSEQKETCLISCGILRDELERIIEKKGLEVEVNFLDASLHSDYKLLHEALTEAIEEKLDEGQKKIILVYGDVCLGFNGEMKELVEKYGINKVDALNCIDCLLGGKGELLEIDPDHEFFYLTPAWIDFTDLKKRDKTEARKLYSVLKGIILIDSLGNLDHFKEEIEEISEHTGLIVLKRKNTGLVGFENLVLESIERLFKGRDK